jgi:hypothetical protein
MIIEEVEVEAEEVVVEEALQVPQDHQAEDQEEEQEEEDPLEGHLGGKRTIQPLTRNQTSPGTQEGGSPGLSGGPRPEQQRKSSEA